MTAIACCYTVFLCGNSGECYLEKYYENGGGVSCSENGTKTQTRNKGIENLVWGKRIIAFLLWHSLFCLAQLI